jgi:Domain of unknown function (DUF4263)
VASRSVRCTTLGQGQRCHPWRGRGTLCCLHRRRIARTLGRLAPSKELSGAVAQIQGTVSAALEQWQARETITTADCEPTGETLFTTEPRSFVICGSLGAFQAEHDINERKFRSFELYRRNLIGPEIITFDELYERARFIVEAEHNNENSAAS